MIAMLLLMNYVYNHTIKYEPTRFHIF